MLLRGILEAGEEVKYCRHTCDSDDDDDDDSNDNNNNFNVDNDSYDNNNDSYDNNNDNNNFNVDNDNDDDDKNDDVRGKKDSDVAEKWDTRTSCRINKMRPTWRDRKKIPSKTKKCSEIFEFFVGTEDSRLEEKFSDNYSDTQETLLKVWSPNNGPIQQSVQKRNLQVPPKATR